MLILLWLSQIWPVTLKIQKYVFSGCTVPPNNNETKLESSYQKLLHQLFPVVWTFLRSLGVICYDRWVLSEGHKKLLQGLVSHELTAYLSVFHLLLTQWIMIILSKGCKPENFESHNSLNKHLSTFVPILLNVNLSLNQTLKTFLLYVRQTWITQLILVISLWGVSFF